MYDIMQYTEKKNIFPCVLLLIDFDKIAWKFIDETRCGYQLLEKHKINNKSRRESYHLFQNGDKEIEFQYIFIFCGKILAIKLGNNKNITCIKIDGKICLISKFADDNSLILDGSSKITNFSFTRIRLFQKGFLSL